VVILGRDMEQLVSRKLGGHAGTVVSIPNWADTDIVSPGDRHANALLAELGLSTRWVVQYAGNMGRTHGLETLVDAAATLRTVAADVHFLLIGSGARMEWLRDAVSRSEGTNNITVLPSRPRSDQNNFLNACDVAVVSFRSGMSGVSVPSRMYNILAAGKPIIAVADDDSELALVVREERVGWVVPPGRGDLLAAAIVAARQEPEVLRAMSVRARRAAEKYTLERAVDAYMAMVGEVGRVPARMGRAAAPQTTAARSEAS
jgi:glycosyltransferase involved in cell wall biosynthesis